MASGSGRREPRDTDRADAGHWIHVAGRLTLRAECPDTGCTIVTLRRGRQRVDMTRGEWDALGDQIRSAA